MGFDLDYPLMYTVSQHRTLQNKVVIGYVIRGEVNISRAFLTGEWSDIHSRLVAASYTDKSLCSSMLEQMNSCLDYGAFHDGKAEDRKESEAYYSASYGDDEEEQRILKEIKQLEDILFTIRGDQLKPDGNYKMPEDYLTESVPLPKKWARTKEKNATGKD